MSEKKPNVPKLRFPGFTEPWEQRKVREIVGATYGGGTPKTEKPDYWNGPIPWIQSSNVIEGELFDVNIPKAITSKGLTESAAHLVPKGSIAVVTHVGVGKLVYLPFPYATSQDFVSLSQLKASPIFVCYALFRRLQTELHMVQGSAIKGITKAELLDKRIGLPCGAEQHQIGVFFRSLDHLITLHQRKLEHLQKLKKGLLQKMFPKDGEVVPEIRFPGFTDPWEQRKLGECFCFLKNNTLSRADLNDERSSICNLHYGDILTRFGECLDGRTQPLPYISDPNISKRYSSFRLEKGDIVFADTAEDETAGKCVELRELPHDGVVAGLHTIPARPNRQFGPCFLGYCLNSPAYRGQLLPLMQGIKVVSLSRAALQDTHFAFPLLEEQKRIGAFLRSLDDLITLHQRKAEHLQKLKKSLLQQMFV